MKITALWDTAPSCLVEIGRRFGGAYCLHHQDDVMEAVYVQVVSARYAPKVNFDYKKNQASTIGGQHFIREASIPQMSLRFIRRPHRARISQILILITVILTAPIQFN
jgi:cephalosporin hydroxylase